MGMHKKYYWHIYMTLRKALDVSQILQELKTAVPDYNPSRRQSLFKQKSYYIRNYRLIHGILV